AQPLLTRGRTPCQTYLPVPCVLYQQTAPTAQDRRAGALAQVFLPYFFFLRTRCLIHEPLTSHAFEQLVSAHRIVDAKLGALAITKIELGQIAMQMMRTHMLINAVDAALENREVAFDRVGVRVVADIFVGAGI